MEAAWTHYSLMQSLVLQILSQCLYLVESSSLRNQEERKDHDNFCSALHHCATPIQHVKRLCKNGASSNTV